MKPIDVNKIKDLFVYHQGCLYWYNPHPFAIQRIGENAGTIGIRGRCMITIDGTQYQRSRLVYAYHYGDPAGMEIDHINRDSTDDRIENLRAVTPSQNCHNRGKYSNNSSGFTGISKTPAGNYQARIMVQGSVYRKTFDTLESAIAWRRKIKQDLV